MASRRKRSTEEVLQQGLNEAKVDEAPAPPKPEAPAPAPAEHKRFQRQLKVKVPDSRVLVLSRELAQCLTRIDEIETERDEVVAGYKDQLKAQKERVAEIREQVRTGTVEEPVECEEIKDYGGKSAKIVRLDTLEVVEVRALTEGELQIGLSFPDDAARATLAQVGQIAERHAAAGGDPADAEGLGLPAEPSAIPAGAGELPGDDLEDEEDDDGPRKPSKVTPFPA